MNKYGLIGALTLIMGLTAALAAHAATTSMKPVTVSSPGKNLTLTVSVANGDLYYELESGGTPLLLPSHIAMRLAGGQVLGEGITRVPKITRSDNRSHSLEFPHAEWRQVTLHLGDYAVSFRAYDHGVAYRFSTTMPGSVTVESEVAEWVLPGDLMTYMAPANSRVQSDDFREQAFCSFENTYVHQPVSRQSRTHLSLAPALADLPDGRHLLVGEYNTRDYPGMFLLPAEDNRLIAYFVPCPKSQHQGGHNNLQMLVDEWEDHIARTQGTRSFPWRMTLVASDEELLTTSIPQSLADVPQSGADFSWVKPGKVAWDWWNWWNITGVDFKAGINNDTYKYYIDFASRNGIEYVILDEGWAVNKQADLMQVVPEINLEELVAYADRRNVGLVLWAGYKAFTRDMEGICRHYAQMGIKGFKIDFMDRNDQEIMRFLEVAAATCARHHLFCDFHGAPAPAGLTVTFPNVLNFEAVAGLEQVKWSTLEEFDEVRHETLLPFIRQVVGPMDYTQGAMRNATRRSYSKNYTQPMSQGTRCRQLALYMILLSPFNMLCDAPTAYEANQECTRFIAGVPVTWDETRVLAAKMGEYVVMARRKGSTWWLGGITNWEPRDLTLDLAFLSGTTMTLFSDGANADRLAEDYRHTSLSTPATLTVHLAPGGGFAATAR
ncbi:MAG: glycoside hydrolase family 97 protein [Muribaculaceae bacterium]|nr:glycoside hydrolase family 97 protein [Muribaculaceae bacterium]